MNWETRYVPPDPIAWHPHAAVSNDSYFYQHTQLCNLLTQDLARTAPITFALLGFKCDEGIQRDLGRIGAAEGPIAIRHQLNKLPIQNPAIHFYDIGNIVCIDHDLEASQLALSEVVAALLKKQIHPIIIGGGHEIAWGHYQGIVKAYPNPKHLGIINFDAHFDMQSLEPAHRGSATTTFYQIAKAHQAAQHVFDYNCIGIQHAGNSHEAFDSAKQYNTRFILADDMHRGLQEKCFDFVDRVVDESDIVYMSLSLDVFSPAFAPGVSVSQPLGLHPWHVIPLLRQAAASGKMISYDIAELLPRYDIDHRTAKLAAALVYEIVHHHSEHTLYK